MPPVPKPSLSARLKGAKVPSSRRTEPLWKGPEADGITQSLLQRFLNCRERFRILVVEGLKPVDSFNHRLGYGDMWHLCEEAAAKEVKHFEGELGGTDTTLWLDNLRAHCQALCKKYPLQQEEIDKWYNVCKVQFPEYVRYWSQHPDVRERKPVLSEERFNVLYRLPSGRSVRLLGKWDSVDLVRDGRKWRLWLQENKTKGDIREDKLQRQLTFDLQTMFYLTALSEIRTTHEADFATTQLPREVWEKGYPLAGVRYNVVRRPLSGGKGSITRHKAKGNTPEETKEHFYARLRDDYLRADPGYWFMRWNVEVTPGEVERFKREFLDPILEQLCDWWNWVSDPELAGPFDVGRAAQGGAVSAGPPLAGGGIHWRHPFGVYNPMDEGRESDLDEHLATGSEVGLERVSTLFPELEPAV